MRTPLTEPPVPVLGGPSSCLCSPALERAVPAWAGPEGPQGHHFSGQGAGESEMSLSSGRRVPGSWP